MQFRKLSVCAAMALLPAMSLAEDDVTSIDETPVSALVATVNPASVPVKNEAARAGHEELEALKALILSDGNRSEAVVVIETAAGEASPVKKFWIGLDCATPDESLRTELKLEPNVGLVIRDVLADSPAKVAGLQVNDVLIQATLGDADHNLGSIAQLSELIQKSEGKRMRLKLLRGGVTTTVDVQPAERPGVVVVAGEEGQRAPRGLHRRPGREGRPEHPHRGGPGGAGPHRGGFSFRMAGPVIVKLGEEMGKLPEDMKITITKTGNQPAEIAVAQGDKSWNVKDSELDQLPAEVRMSLAKFLGMGLMAKLRGSSADFLHRAGGPHRPGMPPGAMSRPHHGEHRQHGEKNHDGRDHHRHSGHREAAAHHGRHPAAQADCPHCQGKGRGAARHSGRHGMHHRGHHHGRMARSGKDRPRGWMAIHQHGGPGAACPHCSGSGRMMAHGHHGPMHHGLHHSGHDQGMCPICNAHRTGHGPMPGMGQSHGPGPGAHERGPSEERLEMLLSRLEKLVGQPGGSTPERVKRQMELRRPPSEGQPAAPQRDQRSGDELRAQLRQLQEQQERMARAIRELNEALERSQRK